eukprot:498646-Pelagomonas_calceolata.AAC.3
MMWTGTALCESDDETLTGSSEVESVLDLGQPKKHRPFTHPVENSQLGRKLVSKMQLKTCMLHANASRHPFCCSFLMQTREIKKKRKEKRTEKQRRNREKRGPCAPGLAACTTGPLTSKLARESPKRLAGLASTKLGANREN